MIGVVRAVVAGAIALIGPLALTESGAPPVSSAEAAPVVRVRAIGPHRTELATGVAVGDRLVLTVAHVLGDADRVRVGGRPACVLVVDRRRDVAVLAVPTLRAPAMALAKRARPGDAWLARVPDDPGAQAADEREISPIAVRRRVVARVHELDGMLHERAALELGSAVAPGDSGSPVLDARGRLMGIVFAASRERRDTSYGVTVDELAEPIEVAAARSCEPTSGPAEQQTVTAG